ncbi:hypothetical protein R3F64_01200 [Halomonas sp. 5021]|uniref:hypothetical protein n=1 Tax=Halomonas sp. 5021 TaxID=3082156 RepID=UPI002FCB2C71
MQISEFESRVLDVVNSYYLADKPSVEGEDIYDIAREAGIASARVIAVLRHQGPLTSDTLDHIASMEKEFVGMFTESMLRNAREAGYDVDIPPT